MDHFHVQSSLPRAGSELLQALLSQNSEVHASTTSPCLEYIFGALSNFVLPEVKSQDQKAMKTAFEGFAREGIKGYYESLTDRSVIVDKSRGWLQYAELLWALYPNAKLICMIRSAKEIISSFEKVYRNNPGHPETRDLPKTVDARAIHWMKPESFPLGLSLQRLYDRVQRDEDKRIIFIDYKDLCNSPQVTMDEIFEFIGVKPIKIDTKNVRKVMPEDSSHFGIFGNHDLLPEIRPHAPDYKDILGKEVCKVIDNAMNEAGLDFLI